MNRTLFLAFSFASASILAGCGAAEEAQFTTDETAAITSEISVSTVANAIPAGAKKLLPASASHLYFNTPSVGYLTDDAPRTYHWFTATPGREFKTFLFEDDGTGSHLASQTVDFKLQRAVKRGTSWQWSLVGNGVHQVGSGAAVLRYTPPASSGEGLYLITAVAKAHPATLTLSISGKGAWTAGQPGHFCGGLSPTPNGCDEGLFCSYEPEAMCGIADAAGTCTQRPEICTKIYSPVCACDGKTYSNSCSAAAAGTGVMRTGRCDVTVTGLWEEQLSTGGRISYRINTDGTFVALSKPACLFAPRPCGMHLKPNYGTYSVLDTTLSLAYSDPSWPQDVTLEYEKVGGIPRLTGTDYGQSLSLIRLMN